MKKLLLLVSIISLNANASLWVKSIELNDSTIIKGNEVFAITLDNEDRVNSIETNNGEVIESSLIKNIILKSGGNEAGGSKAFKMRNILKSSKLGNGQGSGG